MREKKESKKTWLYYSPDTISSYLALEILRESSFDINPSDETDICVKFPANSEEYLMSRLKEDEMFFSHILEKFSHYHTLMTFDDQFVLAVVQSAINAVEEELYNYNCLKKLLISHGAEDYYEE